MVKHNNKKQLSNHNDNGSSKETHYYRFNQKRTPTTRVKRESTEQSIKSNIKCNKLSDSNNLVRAH